METFNAILFCLLVELTLHEGKDHIRACCASNGSPVLVYIFTPHSRSPSQLIVTCITARNENLDAWEQDCICTCSISLSHLFFTPPLSSSLFSPPPSSLPPPFSSLLLFFSPYPSPLLHRLLHPPGILCVPGSAVGLPECACGSESLLHTTDDEHVL